MVPLYYFGIWYEILLNYLETITTAPLLNYKSLMLINISILVANHIHLYHN